MWIVYLDDKNIKGNNIESRYRQLNDGYNYDTLYSAVVDDLTSFIGLYEYHRLFKKVKIEFIHQ